MLVALPDPFEAHPVIAFGADFAARRLIENFRVHASSIKFRGLSRRAPDANCVGRPAPPCGSRTISASLPAVVGRVDWDLLHDVRPGGDPRRYFYLRHLSQTRFPIVFTHHALSHPPFLEGFVLPLLRARAQPYDAVVCTSRAARDAFVKLLEIGAEHLAAANGGGPRTFEGQLPVIPLGVDTDLFRPRDVEDVRHQLGLPTKAFVILWLGRLSHATKADLLPLVRAYRLLRERNPDFETLLVLVGTDTENYASVLHAFAVELGLESFLRIERTTPQNPIHLWYSAADVFVSPIDNLQESFGIASVEAMASGVPQVVSDWNGHRDTVMHGETGFRVRTLWGACDDDAIARWAVWGDSGAAQALLAKTVACDLGELVEYLGRLLHSPTLRDAMSAASRARALAEFGWPVIVKRHADCWSELVDRARHVTQQPQQPHGILPAFFRAFAGYASYVLTGESRVQMHPDAELGIPEKRTVPADGAADSEQLVGGLERVFSTVRERGGELTLDALIYALASDEYSANDVRRLVLWGVKYGLLNVVE